MLFCDELHVPCGHDFSSRLGLNKVAFCVVRALDDGFFSGYFSLSSPFSPVSLLGFLRILLLLDTWCV